MAERLNIITRIISKGGIIGTVAKKYLVNEDNIDLFIFECSEQCHNKMAKDFWGEGLTKDIIDYCNQNLTQTLTHSKHL
jgi:hypothetical protein